MLKAKQISEILSQTLLPIDQEIESTSNSPLAVSLLSSEGLPLDTIINTELLPEHNIVNLSIDSLKIYSLIAINQLEELIEKTKDSLDDWQVLELDKNISCIVQRVLYSDSKAEGDNLYAILFYSKLFPKPVAKLKLDNLTKALSEGLRGYHKTE
ncbi:uncharacterized protein PRCAT00000094001 [Priceomyces carsonii]|uniref:uncharacterized protein n=1 Tax=Priceomyces carsonii TaxID=28549 RepID=UPI002ED99193|nr:unnamed protein product [Priceomyces carsonii]